MTPRRRRRHSPEQVVAKLRDADAMLNSGKWPWPALEDQLRRELTDLDVVAKEAVLVTVYRQGPITHHQLGFSLGLERHETDGLLKRHKVDEDVRRAEELAEEIACLPRLIDG